MKVRWSFYRFNYTRYLELRPRLRVCESYEDFQALSTGKETDFILDQLRLQEIEAEEARAAFVFSLCCQSEPLNVDSGFARCVPALSAFEDSEEGRELLSALLAGGRNLETWMLPSGPLSGFLTPTETVTLYAACVPPARRRRSGSKRKRRRRPIGGLVGACLRFFRMLLDRGPLVDEMLEMFRDMLEEAIQRGEGVAVVAL